MSELRRRVAATRLAPFAALPERLGGVARYDGAVLAASARGLGDVYKRQNLTYDLTDLNMEHLAWWVVGVVHCEVAEARAYFTEVLNDEVLRKHIVDTTLAHPRWRLADPVARYGRRVAWYAIVRHLQPGLVVETGTDKGLGSIVFAAALLRNGHGRLITMDINEDAGYLLSGQYAQVSEIQLADSISLLQNLREPVDLFIHDSLHTDDHETREFKAVAPVLTTRALVLSDNAHVTAALPRWSEEHHRHYLHFQEVPQ